MKKKKAYMLIPLLSIILIVSTLATISIIKWNNEKKEFESLDDIKLTNIGEYNFGYDDSLITIPGVLAGTGIKISDLDGNIIPSDNKVSISGKEKLSFVVTVYNSQEVKNKIELLIFIDNKQISYFINEENTQHWNYSVDMYENSYINCPLEIDLQTLGLSDGIHDIWFICEYFSDKPTTFEERQPYFHTDYHLELLNNSDKYWNESILDNTTKIEADKNTINKFDEKIVFNCEDALENPFTISAKANSDLEVSMDLYYKKNKVQYQTFIIFNGCAIPITDQGDSVIWYSSKNYLSRIAFTIPMSTSEQFNKIYAISFPLSNKDNIIFTSERMNVNTY